MSINHNDTISTKHTESLYVIADAKANRFNIMALTVLAILSVFSFILNEIGLFTAERRIIITVSITSVICFLSPLVVLLIHDKIIKSQKSLLENKNFKLLIIFSSFIGIFFLCVALSYHTILLMVIPPLLSAQYPYNRKLSVTTIVISIVFVPLATYGSFFFGLPDRNFFKDLLTYQQSLHIANRFSIAGERALGIFTHYVLPRIFCVLAIDFLILGISKRNKRMVDLQRELSGRVQHEMERRNALQSKIIEDLAGVIETRDASTGEHVVRTKYYVGIIARELQKTEKYKDVLTDELINAIEESAPLHDIGKIAISDSILLKPGKLTQEEFDVMKKHTSIGGQMVDNIFSNLDDDLLIEQAHNIAKYHHEKWNGKGYPTGLNGNDIPIAARIMAIADVYDALVSKRVYKDPLSHEEAFKIIVSEAGEHFDPYIVNSLLNIENKFKATNINVDE